MKLIIIFFVLIISLSLVSAFQFPSANAVKCFPEYVCNDWGECTDGLKTRICEDIKCDRRDITERDFCGELENCNPSIQCTPWGGCIYTEKIDNFLNGEIKFGGYKTRTCTDASACIGSFVEESSCEEVFPLNLEKSEQCGEEFILAKDASSGKEVARIKTSSNPNAVDIFFTQGGSSFCSSCYNAIKDGDETSIDCGGSCKSCKTEKNFPITPIAAISWILSAAFISLFTIEFFSKKGGATKRHKSF